MSKDKLQQNIRKSTSNCKVCWPRSLSLWTPSWRKHRSLECWEQFCAAWEMGRMSNMETPSLQDNALLQSFSRNLGTVYGIFFMNLCSWEMKTLLLLLLQSHFLSPRWHVSLAQIRMLARALSMQSEISPAPKLPVTAGIVLQSLLTHLALLFGLFSAWLWLHLELQKYHMHALQKKKKKHYCSQCFLPWRARYSALLPARPCRLAWLLQFSSMREANTSILSPVLHCWRSPTGFFLEGEQRGSDAGWAPEKSFFLSFTSIPVLQSTEWEYPISHPASLKSSTPFCESRTGAMSLSAGNEPVITTVSGNVMANMNMHVHFYSVSHIFQDSCRGLVVARQIVALFWRSVCERISHLCTRKRSRDGG